ncbi:ABC transporter ATP-binding protein [Halorussus ruber]|uniref:ABC transporter ATP-binding protein n=1 Tax=Halorussus ruber TaxID=1126238 RepID=UPI0010924D75|nr:ABC transporter ATP-binding protein [Halorussus ruber]
MVVVEATDVVKEYESGETVRALKGVNFEIEAGEFVAIVGPSGSGKSTLLNLVGLLDTPTSGTVRVAGEDIEDHSDRERTSVRKSVVGFVFQSYYLIPTLTALENVVVPCLLDRNPAEAEQRAVDLLERVGLGDRLDHYPDELSGGQKQRVAIARSLINEPDVLLTDEPTGNLDRETGERVLDEFDRVTDEGVAVVTVTHDEYVASFADRVLHLVDGELGTDAPSVEAVGGGVFE